MMGGMDDMNAPIPPMDAEQGMPEDGMDAGMPPEGDMGGDPNAMGGDMTGMEGDPNAADAGGSPEVQQFMQDFQNSDPETQDGTMKYFNSQKKDNGEEQPADAGMPTAPGAMPESRFNFKSIIDETFSTIFGDGNPNNFEKGTNNRPQTIISDDAMTEYSNPYLPR